MIPLTRMGSPSKPTFPLPLQVSDDVVSHIRPHSAAQGWCCVLNLMCSNLVFDIVALVAVSRNSDHLRHRRLT